MNKLLSVCAVVLVATLPACGGGGSAPDPGPPVDPPPPPVVVPVDGPAWQGFAGNAQHTALHPQGQGVASQSLRYIYWSAAVDLAPPYSTNGALLAHYGSPLITRRNTVVTTVKTSAAGEFRVEARVGANGAALWSLASDYRLPPHRWVPSFNPALAGDDRVLVPAAGGRLLVRDGADSAAGSTCSFTFDGDAVYSADSVTYDRTVYINTPITTDRQGNAYFGFTVTGANPAGLAGGIARVSADGRGLWVATATAAGDAAMSKTAMNSAPALSADENTLYVVVNSQPPSSERASGRLLALDSTTLATRANVLLLDPVSGSPAWVNDNASSSPTVGPDGRVYVGVLEAANAPHNFRGWLLQFNADLTSFTSAGAPGSFGWDNTVSIVPTSMLPQYTGGSPYLLLLKSNSYGGIGTGDGQHRMAIVDPRQTQSDAFSTATVMREVITILGPTPDPNYAGGVKEWCVNTAAVDPLTQSVLMNSEDGRLYRWHLPSNRFTESIALNNGYAQSYTPTALGADGRVYAVNNGRVFSVGER
jgi:hypothetical protein